MDMGDDGEDDDFNRSDDEMFDNNPEGGRKPGAADDSDVEVQDAPGASVIDLDDDDDSSPVKKKPGPVKKRALGPKATETTAGTKRGRKPAGSSSETDKPVKVSVC